MNKIVASIFVFILMLLPALAAAESGEIKHKPEAIIIQVDTEPEVSEGPEGTNTPEPEAPEDPEGTDTPEPEAPEGPEGTETPEPEAPEDPEGTETPEATDPGLLPDSPFYFLKRFAENVKIWLTFNEESKTELLADLIDLRARELEALEEKYAEEELTEKQLAILEKATLDLQETAEGLFQRLIGDGEDLEDLELSDEQISRLELALINLADALDRVADVEVEEEKTEKQLKFEQRITHLERVMEINPATAEKGLSRAIENARRQQARWEQKKGIEDTDPLEAPENPEQQIEETEDLQAPESPGKGNEKDKGKDKDKAPGNSGNAPGKSGNNPGKGN